MNHTHSLHWVSTVSCCFWLLLALLNKARWAGRNQRVSSHHTHTIHSMPCHQVYTSPPAHVYIGGEKAPSKVITLVHLIERMCVLNVAVKKSALFIEGF